MTDDIYTEMVSTGRVSRQLAEQRRLRESGEYKPGLKVGASRGFLAGRVSNYVGLIKSCLRLSGSWARGKRNAREIKVRHNPICLPRLPHEFEGYTILHLSDLHLDIAEDMADVIASSISQLDYDICVITGDFRAETSGSWLACMQAFDVVQAQIKTPVFAILGNHDCLAIAHELEKKQVTMLMNEHRMIAKGQHQLALIGIDDPHYFETDDLPSALEGIPQEATKILLSHTPETYDIAAQLGVDCLFAGHTHGGQICLPGGFPIIVNADCPRSYCRGPWQHQKLQGYTSTGTGSSVIDVRFNCPPEAVLHRLCRG